MRKVRILVLAAVVAGFGLIGVAPQASASCMTVDLGDEFPPFCVESVVCKAAGLVMDEVYCVE